MSLTARRRAIAAEQATGAAAQPRTEPRDAPPRRSGLFLERPRLDAIPFTGEFPPVILLRAPAGYGKTYQVSRWLEVVSGPVIVVTPSAAERPLERLGQALGVDKPRSLRELLASAANADRPLTLVVDAVGSWDKAWEEAVRALLTQRWPSLRMWIATRAMPNIGAERLAAHGELCELGPQDLRFTREEAEDLISLSGALVDPALKGAFISGVNGWPVALQMGLKLLKQKTAAPSRVAAEMIRPGGSLDSYIRAEILARETPDLQRLMMETGAMGAFSSELVETATGRANGASLLAQLQSRTGLLAPAADIEDGLAYEPLIGAYLEGRLRREDPPAARQIHTAMARWRQARRQFGQAVTEALAAQDLDLAAELLAQASDARERIGRWRAFTALVSKIPPELLARYPEIRIEAGASCAILFEFEAARAHLAAARQCFEVLSDRAKDDLFTAEAILATFSDDAEEALAAGDRGLAQCPGDDPYTVGALHTAVAVGWIGRGEPEKAREYAKAGQAIHQNAGSRFGEIFALSLIGSTHAMEARLGDAIAAWQRAESIAEPSSTAAAVDAIAVGYMPEVLYERDEIAAAEVYLARGLASSVEIALPDIITSLYLTGVKVALAHGARDRAGALLQEAEVTGMRREWPRLVRAAGWCRVWWALREGRPHEAKRHGQKLLQDTRFGPAARSSPHSTNTEGDDVGELRLAAHLAPDRKLLATIRAQLAQARGSGRDWRATRLSLVEAVARDGLADRHGALRAVRRALELGAPGRLVRSFADEGPIIAALIGEIVEAEAAGPSTLDSDHLMRVAAACGQSGPALDDQEQDAVEALSPREVDVLRMVAAGLSNQELARRLYVSENTVKWHLQHIFAKLGVRNRTRASVVTRELRLIA